MKRFASPPPAFDALLVANRGEIAHRVLRSARALGLRTIAVHASGERDAPHVAAADEALELRADSDLAAYLSIEAVIDACRRSGAGAVHPGYGFLSENPAFARACAAAGIVFVGPSAEAIEALGDKAQAKAIAQRAGVPCRVEADVRPALWDKLVMNCAYNAISALGRSRYGAIIDDADVRALMRETIEECVAVARADGVPLADASAHYDAAMRLGEAMREASSSMEQDLANGRRTEIDSLNGYVVGRGAALGVTTPTNRVLTTLVRLLERSVVRHNP